MLVKTHIFNMWNSLKLKGFDVKENNEFLCLKSNIPLHRCNLAWNFGNQNDIDQAIEFFQGNNFILYNSQAIESEYLEPNGYMYEMELISRITNEINSLAIYHAPDTLLWVDTLSRAVGQDVNLLYPFIKSMKYYSSFYLLLISLDDKPIATSAISIEQNIAVISFVTVLSEYRGRGIGSIITQEAIKLGANIGAEKFYLYASDDVAWPC
jgi:GNAT superfamily N-acetyltransferase